MKTTFQVVQKLSPGGIETMALDFAQQATPTEQHFIVSLEGTLPALIHHWPRLKQIQHKIICLDKPAGISLKTIQRLVKLIKKMNVTCIHTHHIGPLLYGSLAAKLAGVRCIMHTEHDAWHLENKKNRWLQRLIMNITRPIFIADSQLVADNAARFLGNYKMHVIYNGINTEKFQLGDQKKARTVMKLPLNVTLIGNAGRLEDVKGQRVLIEALINLPSHIHLAIAGIGSNEQKLKALTKQLKLSNRVHFLGLIDNMPAFYQSLDVFCLPSFKEGFPLSALEAQACGIAAVLTNTGASTEALCHQYGEIVDTGDNIGMANAIAKVCERINPVNPHNGLQPDSHNAMIRNFVKTFADSELMLKAYNELKNST
ncbi:glycosyltransferase [Algibacillus agarilyticus]|uniref:glycosyltransferase n=1 Tax=Algibacillus agarilyticus TaxID=2234133 RepID=UPI000DCFA508|nr:glycosyltransferase [Algibacillus agarilyticus]